MIPRRASIDRRATPRVMGTEGARAMVYEYIV